MDGGSIAVKRHPCMCRWQPAAVLRRWRPVPGLRRRHLLQLSVHGRADGRAGGTAFLPEGKTDNTAGGAAAKQKPNAVSAHRC